MPSHGSAVMRHFTPRIKKNRQHPQPAGETRAAWCCVLVDLASRRSKYPPTKGKPPHDRPYTAATPNGYKVSVTLEELGTPYTVHPVDMAIGGQKTSDFPKSMAQR